MKKIFSRLPLSPRPVSWILSVIPVGFLTISFITIIISVGASGAIAYSPIVLLCSAALALGLAAYNGSVSRRGMSIGLCRSARQVLPAIPMLICIAALATTWMLSGIVPTLVHYGLSILDPKWFLITCCAVCAMVSVLTGSSWSTIATIGVAFMGIGHAMGYEAGWTAGAIISGAYFGDKVSPLSDTTVIASSTCGVDLFSHIRYMAITTIPAMSLALIIFGIKGFTMAATPLEGATEMHAGLGAVFTFSPYILIIPVLTLTMIALRVPTLVTLAGSAVMGAVAMFIFQPHFGLNAFDMARIVWAGSNPDTGFQAVDDFIATGGISGILPVVCLVASAMIFGWVMIGTGMLESVTAAVTRAIRRPVSAVAATIVSGMSLNMATADQYLSIIISGNMYRGLYRRLRLESRLLSRSIEDSVSVTSPMIPWSSCGVTQSTVLGVPTLTYLPYCVFNYLTPIMSMLMIYTGYKIRRVVIQTA